MEDGPPKGEVGELRNWLDIAAWKKGESVRTSSWAAKIRCSGPTMRVMMAAVRLLREFVSAELASDKLR